LADARSIGCESQIRQALEVRGYGDTQWKATADPLNPATCAVEIIETLNRQFIDAGVSFVV
jgi:hypothetical protein